MTEKYLFNLLSNYKPEDQNKTNIFFYGLTYALKEREKDITMECIKESIPTGAIPYLSHILNKYMNFIQDKNNTKFWEASKIHSMLNQYRIEDAKTSKEIGYLNIDNWDDNKFSTNLSNYLKRKYFADELELERVKNNYGEFINDIKESDQKEIKIKNSNCDKKLEEIVEIEDDGLTYSLFGQDELDKLSNYSQNQNNDTSQDSNNFEDPKILKQEAQKNKSLDFLKINTNSFPPERVVEELERRRLF
ncbi:MAG: hypothetical protein PHT94_04485 [Candidatus Nanoarchaeia archaeon]|nr:hypothetical protein [Candidatus Nanoarchaeia archaeon]